MPYYIVETVGIAYFREAEFYYNRNELFYIKYKAINFVNKIEEMKYYNLFIFELEKELNENQDLKKWIIDENEKIIKECINY